MISIYATAMVLARVTVVLVAGLAWLRLARRSTPEFCHLICLVALIAAVLVLPTLMMPERGFVIYVPALDLAPSAGTAGAGQGAWPQYAIILWACGCAAVLLRYVTGVLRLSWALRSAARVDSRRGFGTPGVPLMSADVNAPLVTGLFRPVIVVPRTASEWSESQHRAVLCHETAHLKRGDLWANFVAAMVSAIYWFHPLVWVLVRRLRDEQEAACDDAVLRSGYDRVEYAEALMEVANSPDGHLLPDCSMAGRMGVKDRVRRILALGEEQFAPPMSRWRSATVCAALVSLLAGLSLIGAEGVYKFGDGIIPPTLIEQIHPEYTAQARDRKIQGKVQLSFIVGADGIARDIVVTRGIDPGLDRNAVKAVQRWRFKPAARGSLPVAMRASVEIKFWLM
jgi:TonB family protein